MITQCQKTLQQLSIDIEKQSTCRREMRRRQLLDRKTKNPAASRHKAVNIKKVNKFV